jgi:hypothetical protein
MVVPDESRWDKHTPLRLSSDPSLHGANLLSVLLPFLATHGHDGIRKSQNTGYYNRFDEPCGHSTSPPSELGVRLLVSVSAFPLR